MYKNSPTVSVIIPTYNRAHCLIRSIRSVLNQTYQNFEIIIVDDGSSDNTEKLIGEYIRNDRRIRYIKHEKNKGAAAARNTGIRAANGKYIAFQDSDDVWMSDKLKKQMDIFATASSEVGVVYTGFWRIELNKEVYIPPPWVVKKDGNIHQELLRGNYIGTPSIVIRKECTEKAGMFDESLPALEDWDLFLRFSKRYHFKCIDEPLLTAYSTFDNISGKNEAFIEALKLILLNYYDDFAKDKESFLNHYFRIVNDLKLNDDFKSGRNYLIKVARINPLNFKILVIAFLSFFGKRFLFIFLDSHRKLKRILGQISSNLPPSKVLF